MLLKQLDNQAIIMLIARVLLVWIFFVSGLDIFFDITGTINYSTTKDIPELLVWSAFALKLIAGSFVIVGFQTRISSLVLAIFTLCTAVIFHYGTGTHYFIKEISMIGGLLLLATTGAGCLSIDAILAKK